MSSIDKEKEDLDPGLKRKLDVLVGENKKDDFVWENYENPNKEIEFTSEQKAKYFELIKSIPIYPKIRIQKQEKAGKMDILISTLLRQKLNDGKYYIGEIHQRTNSINYSVEVVEKILNTFHEFIYLNITSRTMDPTELDVIDVENQDPESERLQKIMRNGK